VHGSVHAYEKRIHIRTPAQPTYRDNVGVGLECSGVRVGVPVRAVSSARWTRIGALWWDALAVGSSAAVATAAAATMCGVRVSASDGQHTVRLQQS
jgi:hypothetical protein